MPIVDRKTYRNVSRRYSDITRMVMVRVRAKMIKDVKQNFGFGFAVFLRDIFHMEKHSKSTAVPAGLKAQLSSQPRCATAQLRMLQTKCLHTDDRFIVSKLEKQDFGEGSGRIHLKPTETFRWFWNRISQLELFQPFTFQKDSFKPNMATDT